MHSKGVSHRDLKPDNILVGQNYFSSQCEVKIIDFGVSKLFLQKSKHHTRVSDMWTRTGTILYSAPEIFEGGGYNEKGSSSIFHLH
jgi:calcium-dependent protein kinase